MCSNGCGGQSVDCTNPYSCPTACPGYLREPYHIPGYGGHVPSLRYRFGGSFGKLSHDCIEDPCVAQAPIPILQAPGVTACPDTPCCCDTNHGVFVPRGCGYRCTGGTDVYRCCEPMNSSYAGHVPGLNQSSLGRTYGKATFGSKNYMDKCFYYNTFSPI